MRIHKDGTRTEIVEIGNKTYCITTGPILSDLGDRQVIDIQEIN